MPRSEMAAISMLPDQDGSVGRALRGDEVAVPEGAVLEAALLRGVIDIQHAETLGIARIPLEVIHQAPVEIAAHVDTLCDHGAQGIEVQLHVLDARLVMDLAVNGLV